MAFPLKQCFSPECQLPSFLGFHGEVWERGEKRKLAFIEYLLSTNFHDALQTLCGIL